MPEGENSLLDWPCRKYCSQETVLISSKQHYMRPNIHFINLKTLFSLRLHRAQHITTIFSMRLSSTLPFCSTLMRLIGRVEPRIVYFCLNTPIRFSTWILTWETSRADPISLRQSCFFPSVNEGAANSAQNKPKPSSNTKPRSASTKSPGRSLSRNPLCSVRCLSVTRPPHALDTKEILPCGVNEIRNFTVLCCL